MSTFADYCASLAALSTIEATLDQELRQLAARRDQDAVALAVTRTALERRRSEVATKADQALADGANYLSAVDLTGLLPKKCRPTPNTPPGGDVAGAMESVDRALDAVRRSAADLQLWRKSQREAERRQAAERARREVELRDAEAQRRRQEAERAEFERRRKLAETARKARRRRLTLAAIAVGSAVLLILFMMV